MTKQQMIDLIDLLQDNVDNIILQSPDIMDGLEAYGYSVRSLGDTVMMSKVTTPRSEALQTTDATTLATWSDHEEMIIAGVIGSTPPESVLVGNGDTDSHTTLKELAKIFGYVLTDQDIEDEPGFWGNAIQGIFDGSVGVLNASGDFYLSYQACQRAYDVFASLGQGGSDVTIYYDDDDVELPMAMTGDGHGVYFTNDSAGYQSRTGAKQTLTSFPGIQGIQYGINIFKLTPYDNNTYYGLAILLEESRWNESQIIIDTITTKTYMDDTTFTYHSNIVLSPSVNTPTDDRIVTLGGTRYWIYENYASWDGGTNAQECWPTPYYIPPTNIGQGWYTQFIQDNNGFTSTHTSGGGGSITLPEIPGVTHPTQGDTFENTYPTEYAHNLEDDPDVYIYIDSTDFAWSDWYDDSNRRAEDERGGDNPGNPGGYDEGDGHSPELPDDDGNNTGFTACYHPDKATVESFCKWLWTDPSQSLVDWSQFARLFSNPMDTIISLHKIYATPANAPSRTTIQLGYIDTNISCDYCDDTHIQVGCGTITIPEYFKNSMDYDEFTSISIFLPFIGFKELAPTDVIGKSLTVTYNVDIVSGACVCDIRVAKGDYSCSIAQYGGNCAATIPITSPQHTALIANITGLGLAGGATLVTGGAAAPFAATVAAMANTMINSKAQISRGGSISSNIGELSVKKPFVIVRRHHNSTPYRYQDISGYPASSNIALRSCSGYTRIKEIHLDAIHATEKEKQELEALLKGGVEF